ncbi:MAG: EF-hand domain-containing protein [Pseudomonadota bacterium]
MSSLISNLGQASSAMLRSTQPQRSTPSELVDKVFAQLDTNAKGYLDKADIQTAYNNVTSASANTDTASSKTDALFEALDNNNDGQITKQEMKDTLQKFSDQLDNQFNEMRTSGPSNEARPAGGPPPGGGGGKPGGTEESASTSSSAFDPADTNQDGKVSETERLAYQQSQQASSTSQSSESAVQKTVMQLMKAYGAAEQNTPEAYGAYATNPVSITV